MKNPAEKILRPFQDRFPDPEFSKISTACRAKSNAGRSSKEAVSLSTVRTANARD
jgi:hypothetical protein